MNTLQAILEFLWVFFCRHEWVRDRDESGQLVNRCMRCGGIKEDRMTQLVRWRPEYQRIEPSTVTELAIPVVDSARQRNAGKWHPPSYRNSDSGSKRSAA